jgi:hypothetical protein
MRTKATILAALLALTGCASYVWDKPNSSEAEFQRESGQCAVQGLQISNPGVGQQQAVYNACMQGKGWYQRKA